MNLHCKNVALETIQEWSTCINEVNKNLGSQANFESSWKWFIEKVGETKAQEIMLNKLLTPLFELSLYNSTLKNWIKNPELLNSVTVEEFNSFMEKIKATLVNNNFIKSE